MTEEEEISGEKENDLNDYSQIDPLIAIGYQAEPDSIYYINPPQELSTYPMYIENPEKKEKNIGSFISYTLNGTDITEKMSRRYSDFFALYEKLVQRWPGVYIPKIPPKIMTKTTSKKTIKIRLRLLNRFCLNLSKIDYLYNSEETNIFKGNSQDIANLINKLPELSLEEIVKRMKEAFPQYDENYDILLGKPKITEFNNYLKKHLKTIESFQKVVETALEKRDQEKKNYIELMKGLVDYEKNSISIYTENQVENLIFNNPSYSEFEEKIKNLNKKMINYFIILKDWLEEEILDTEAMFLATEMIDGIMEKEDKTSQKLETIEAEFKKVESGGSSFKTLFKKKVNVIAEITKEKDETQNKLDNLRLLVKILADNMEKQIEKFKKEKTQSYYRYLKIFAILQKESNKVMKETWTIVKNALNDLAPNAQQSNEDYVAEPISKEQVDIEQMDADEGD